MALASIPSNSTALMDLRSSNMAPTLNKVSSGTKISSEPATTGALTNSRSVSGLLTPAPDPKAVAYQDSKIALDSILLLQRTDPAKVSDSAVRQAIETYATASQNYSGNESRTGASYGAEFANAQIKGMGSLMDADAATEIASSQALQSRLQIGIQTLSSANQSTQTIARLFGG